MLSGLAWNQPYSRYGQDIWATYQSSGNATVTFSILDSSGRRVRDLGEDVPEGPGAHAVDWDGYADNGSPVPDGVYTLTLDSVDSSGAKQSLSASITIDTQAPLVRFATRRLRRSSTLVVTVGDATTGVSSASLTVGNRVVARGGAGAGQLRYRPHGGWKPGSYPVAVRAQDRAGNRAYVARTFRVKA